MRTTESRIEALLILGAEGTGNRVVTSCMWFADAGNTRIGNYHIFKSNSSPGQAAMGRIQREYRAGIDNHTIGRQLWSQSDHLVKFAYADLVGAAMGLKPPMHAEEELIKYLTETGIDLPRSVSRINIWVSHSPCIPGDREPSNNLKGWPPSCSRKLKKLAEWLPYLTITVAFREAFGANQIGGGATAAGQHAQATLTAQCGRNNLLFLFDSGDDFI